MKAILEFDLQEEKEEYEDAFNGRKYSLALWELSQRIRGFRKYGIPEEIKTPDQMLEAIQATYLEVCQDLPSIP